METPKKKREKGPKDGGMPAAAWIMLRHALTEIIMDPKGHMSFSIPMVPTERKEADEKGKKHYRFWVEDFVNKIKAITSKVSGGNYDIHIDLGGKEPNKDQWYTITLHGANGKKFPMRIMIQKKHAGSNDRIQFHGKDGYQLHIKLDNPEH